MGCHFLLQGIFLTQGLNPSFLCLLYWQADSFPSRAIWEAHKYWLKKNSVEHCAANEGSGFCVCVMMLSLPTHQRTPCQSSQPSSVGLVEPPALSALSAQWGSVGRSYLLAFHQTVQLHGQILEAADWIGAG